MHFYKPYGKILIVLLCLASLMLPSQTAYAAAPEELEPSFDEDLLYDLWYGRMLDIVELFRQWSAYNGVDDGGAYCTTNGKPFGVATGDTCYIGSVTQAMRREGFIDYTVTGGWSCNGFVRFAIRALYGRTFWRSEMTENIYTVTLFSTVGEVQEFVSRAKIGDMLCIMGYADHDNDGRRNDEYWHYMMYISSSDEGILVMDGNFDHYNGVQIHLVSWEFIMSRQWIYVYSVSQEDHLSVLDQLSDEPQPVGSRGGGEWTLLYQ